VFKTAYIYDYVPGGKVAGKQVRFKRTHRGRVETTSQYFSIAKFGSLRKAFVLAVRWRDRNIRWLWDRRFEPKYVDLVAVRRHRPALARRRRTA
jgi:hypothetical protein